MWVFGPDVDPPANVEVWLQDERGLPVRQLYPAPTGDYLSQETFVGHIAGVEGGGIDPIAEAKRRGEIIAIARLGNKRHPEDAATVHQIYRQELQRARARYGGR